jgi:hypothetical protein
MSVFVFTGPTLPPAQARAELDAIYLPPASQGDVYRVSQARPRAIGIIDGFFDQVPSVWHKEILWAMRQGIAVFGSASMGALRAAELAPFGMFGVGKIFEAYRDGRIEDDDEVALIHGPAESGFLPGSEAMVNIRATLAAAQAGRVIPPKTRLALESVAKRLFYPERAWDAILERAAADGLPSKQLDRFRAWLPSGRVDQKREDALAMLRAMRDHLAAPAAARQVSYRFENTVFWDRLVQSAGTLAPGPDGTGSDGASGGAAQMVPFDDLLDELRLDPDAYLEAHRECLLRQLILAEARRRGFQSKPEEAAAAAAEFRANFGIEDPAAFELWLAERRLTAQRFDEWMVEEALIRAVGADLWQETGRALPDLLLFDPGYAKLMRRAGKKRRALAEAGLEIADVDEDPDALWDWFLAESAAAASPFEARSILQRFSPNEAEALLRAKSRNRHFRRLTTPRPKNR